MVKEGADHQPMVLFKKENTDADKRVPVINCPPVRFIGAPPKQGITGNIQGEWDPDILVAVITEVGVPADEALSDIGMDDRRSVINLEYDGE